MEIKYCRDCNTELIIGKNITLARFNNCTYRCKRCNSIATYTYQQKNPEKRNKTKLQWYYNNKEKHIEEENRRISKIPPSVYAIVKDKKIIYIGESKKPLKRSFQHFSKYTKEFDAKTQSEVAHAIFKGELKREDLSIIMLDQIDDDNARQKRERELIRKEKPKYNQKYLATLK